MHTRYKDHVVVLSTNEAPPNINLTCWWEENAINIQELDTKYPVEFAKAIETVIEEAEQLLSESSDYEGQDSFDK